MVGSWWRCIQATVPAWRSAVPNKQVLGWADLENEEDFDAIQVRNRL